jgi:hypothetical protein
MAMGKKVEMEHTNDPKKAKEIARDHLEEFDDYYTRLKEMEDKADAAKEKSGSAVTDHLNTLWLAYTPDLEEMEKSAAAQYFYDLQKPTLDAEALGSEFCKLAEAFDKDPWYLACEVEDHFGAFEVLSKTASGPSQELA